MLIDAVGSFWDAGYKYYLKHREPGQVDAEGKPTSTTLGMVNIQGDWDAFSFQVCGVDRDKEMGLFYNVWEEDVQWGKTDEQTMWAMWTYSKRAIIYADKEETQQVGWLDITGSGMWYQKKKESEVWDEDENGNKRKRSKVEWDSDCKVLGFKYKFSAFNMPMLIKYNKVLGGGFASATQLEFTASNAWAPDVPVWTARGGSSWSADVESFDNSDPVSAILAAYAISCRLSPPKFKEGAQKMCEKHIKLGMPQGYADHKGLSAADFEARFGSYAAPVPVVYAQAVAAYTPPPVAQPVFAAP